MADQLLFKTLGQEHHWVRIEIDNPSHISSFLNVAEPKTAVLFKESQVHPSCWDEQFFAGLIKEHIACAQKLSDAGIKKIAILAADDGILHKILSPRFSTLDLDQRVCPVLSIFSELKEMFDEVVVWLIVEELAPGGLDATDGVEIAKKLQDLGLKHIVALSGTRDFAPLFYRRATKEKNEEEFISNEPALASALWLIKNTSLQVSSASIIDDQAVALKLGHQLAIASLIPSKSSA